MESRANLRAEVRADLQQKLRSYLQRGETFPEPILPGSKAILPIPSAPLDLFDPPAYAQMQEDMNLEVDTEALARANVRATLKNQLRSYLERGETFPEPILPGSKAILPIPSAPLDLFDPPKYLQLDA